MMKSVSFESSKDSFVNKLKTSFIEYLNRANILGDYLPHCVVLALVISTITILVIVVALKNLGVWVYFVLAISSILFVALLGFLGFSMKHKTKVLSKGQIIDYTFRRIVYWTKGNLKRPQENWIWELYLVNLLGCYYEYLRYTNKSYLEGYLDMKSFMELINSKKSVEVELSFIKKFIEICKNKRTSQLNELVYIVKVLIPLLYLSNEKEVTEILYSFCKEFVTSTRINIFTSQIKMIGNFNKKEKLLIYPNYFQEENILFKLFYNYNLDSPLQDQRVSLNESNFVLYSKTIKLTKRLNFEFVKELDNERNSLLEVKEEPKDEIAVDMNCENSEDKKSFNLSVYEKLDVEVLKEGPEVEKEDEKDPVINELFGIVSESLDNYEVIIKKDNINIYKKIEEGNPVVLIRSHCKIHANVHKVYKAIIDLEHRNKWDKVFSKMKILKIIDNHNEVMYSYIKAPPLISDRDWVQRRVCFKNAFGFDYFVGFKNYVDDKMPILKGVIRAETVRSGYLFKSNGENSCDLTIVSQTDIKGYIPKIFVNAAAQKSPLRWIKNLEKYVLTIED